MTARRFVTVLLFILSGLLVWAAQFTVIYAFNTMACTRAFTGVTVLGFGIVPFGVTLATVAAVATSLWLLYRGFRSPQFLPGEIDSFVTSVASAVTVLAVVAMVWNWLPALIVPPCG